MAAVPFDDLHRQARDGMQLLVDAAVERAQVAERHPARRLAVGGELDGMTVSVPESAEVLGAQRCELQRVEPLQLRDPPPVAHE